MIFVLSIFEWPFYTGFTFNTIYFILCICLSKNVKLPYVNIIASLFILFLSSTQRGGGGCLGIVCASVFNDIQ